eukprot:COSAG01_NODE_69357_length_261_cov_1.277778_1_plen_83_part_10
MAEAGPLLVVGSRVELQNLLVHLYTFSLSSPLPRDSSHYCHAAMRAGMTLTPLHVSQQRPVVESGSGLFPYLTNSPLQRMQTP